jgi:uncharacterized protein YqeY
MKQRIFEELKKAMRAKDEVRLRTLRGLMAEIKNKEIELRVVGDGLREGEILKLIQKEIKKRREAIEMYKKVGREELAEQEGLELEVLNEFAPKQMSESEIRKVVAGVKGSDFGLVMREAMKELKGKADGVLVARVVREQLAGI